MASSGKPDPFRPFLSPKVKFEWTTVLQLAFEAGKLEIFKAIEKGVEIFDPGLHTCLRTDWSKAGMGYYLCQKVCECEDLACCTGGWRICLAGSRFNSGAESR